jgi:hypothetical protein
LDPSFQIKTQALEKVFKQAHIPYILAWHLQIDADPVPDPAYHFDADPVPDFYLMWMRIQVTKMMRIRIRMRSRSTTLAFTIWKLSSTVKKLCQIEKLFLIIPYVHYKGGNKLFTNNFRRTIAGAQSKLQKLLAVGLANIGN